MGLNNNCSNVVPKRVNVACGDVPQLGTREWPFKFQETIYNWNGKTSEQIRDITANKILHLIHTNPSLYYIGSTYRYNKTGGIDYTFKFIKE